MKLHATVLGEGKPFLILHGFLGMGDNWKTLGKEFAENDFQVHLVDQRNHGRSPHSEDFSYLHMAKDIMEYCEEHDLKNIILMGHSMGGKTAMLAAALFPDLVEKLIVVDIAPRYYAPHHQQILAGLNALRQENLSSRGEAEDVLEKYVEEKGVRMFLLKNLYWKSKGELALRMNLEVLEREIEKLGEAIDSDKKYNKPTLFIKGERSGYISEEDKNLISSHFPESEIISIPNAGHWVHAEQKDEFYKTVMKFLSVE